MLTPFDHALAEESKWLAKVIDQTMPDDFLTARRVYIGPTGSRFMLRSNPAAIAERERALLRKWRATDLSRHYAGKV